MRRITSGRQAPGSPRQASEFEQIFGGFIAANQRLASSLKSRGDGARAQHHTPAADWRAIERLLVDYLQSYRVPVLDEAGMPVLEVVRFREPEEIVTARISLEHLANFLAQEIGR